MTAARLLILSCSASKRDDPEPTPAIERYDGPLWRVLRSFLREQPDAAASIDIWALSAEHGLIPANTLLLPYERRMSPERADELRPRILENLEDRLNQGYTQLCLAISKDYLRALLGWEKLLTSATEVTITDGTAGVKLAQLRAWLEGGSWQPPEKLATMLYAPGEPRGVATVAGVKLQMTRDEVIARARAALAQDKAGAQAYRDWCVRIDGQPVAPKWLISVLSGKPTTSFQAAAARQALLALGIDVERAG